MPVAAVPSYLPAGQFSHASPALRFGLLLSIWTDRKDQEREVIDRSERRSREAEQLRQELGPNNENLSQVTNRLIAERRLPSLWQKNDHAGRKAWDLVSVLSGNDRATMQALAARTDSLAKAMAPARVWSCAVEATSPFTTGLGNEHPLENGFSFLNPYGLPYLPGSGVKGVVREAARQLAEGMWEDSRGWDKETVGHCIVVEDGEKLEIPLTALDVLLGRETPEGESGHFRGVLTFWDVVPQIAGDRLRVEVMTPHQSHYYQQKADNKSGNSTAPHDSGQPNPILFLTVPPGSKFHFHVVCDLARLKRVAPALLEEDRWRKLLEAAFEHAFDWLGFGAKTAVGYGAMRRQHENAPDSDTAAPQGAAEKMAPGVPAAEEQVWENATLKWNPGKQELSASAPGKASAILTQKAAQDFLNGLPEDRREQLKKKKSLGPVSIRIKAEGNKYTITGMAQPE